MSNSLIPQDFDFSGQSVRTFLVDGEPWFVLRDVLEVLGHSNPTWATKGLDEDEFSFTKLTDSTGREQEMLIISEPGLYRLLQRSRKPVGRAFARWVAHQVIPAIRRNGFYVAPTSPAVNPTGEVAALASEIRKILPLFPAVAGQLNALAVKQEETDARVAKMEEEQRLRDPLAMNRLKRRLKKLVCRLHYGTKNGVDPLSYSKIYSTLHEYCGAENFTDDAFLTVPLLEKACARGEQWCLERHVGLPDLFDRDVA